MILSFDAKFPTNLILSKKSLTKYQIIFRHLLKCKHLERQLVSSWLQDKNDRAARFSSPESFKHVKSKISSLRARMVHFIQSIAYYIYFEVLCPHWDSMAKGVQSVSFI
jgi:gamma-tubulin complex component 2